MKIRKPSLSMLSDRALLALAAKKAFKLADRRQWYHDRTESLSFMARLNFHVARLSREIEFGTYVPAARTVFLAPERIESRDKNPLFHLVICQNPSQPASVDDAMNRR